jgi:hypothetical protein
MESAKCNILLQWRRNDSRESFFDAWRLSENYGAAFKKSLISPIQLVENLPKNHLPMFFYEFNSVNDIIASDLSHILAAMTAINTLPPVTTQNSQIFATNGHYAEWFAFSSK